MKTFFLLAFILCEVVCAADPQLITFGTKVEPSKPHALLYSEYVMKAPHFYVDQEHEGLKDLFDAKGSPLCFPASLATALLNQKSTEPLVAEKLKLPGAIEGTQQVDANALVRSLATCAKTDLTTGTTNLNGAACIAHLYREAGITPDIKLIRNYAYPDVDPDVQHQQRKPSPLDIKQAIDQGYEVIAMIDWEKSGENRHWTWDGGHFFNLYGYARQSYWPSDLFLIYVSNPDRLYHPIDNMPTYDALLLQPSEPDKDNPDLESSYFFEGAGFGGMLESPFLSSLIIFKPKP